MVPQPQKELDTTVQKSTQLCFPLSWSFWLPPQPRCLHERFFCPHFLQNSVYMLHTYESVPPQNSREGWHSSLFDSQFNQPGKVQKNYGWWTLDCGSRDCEMCSHKRSLQWQAGDKENAARKDITAAALTTQTCTRSGSLSFDFMSYCRSLHLWNGSFSSLSFSGWAASPPPLAVVYLYGNSGAAAGTKWLPDAGRWHRWEPAKEKALTENAFLQMI